MKFNKILDNLKVYEAGKPIELVVREFKIEPESIIKLASNENPYGASKLVKSLLSKNLDSISIYPDDSMYELKEALADRFKVDSKNLIIGQGSDQVIEFAIRSKARPNSKVLTSNITFAMYEIYSHSVGAKVLKTNSNEHNLDEFYQLYLKESPDIIFLCTPNNPLGEALDRDKIYNFLEKIDSETLVVIDGAYQEYAKFRDDSKSIEPLDLISKFENTLYLGTFSKAYSLGGMRIGYGIAKPEIIEHLGKLRSPFNITTLSLKAATKALEDREFVDSSISKNFEQMSRYEKFCKDRDLEYIQSYTNFITILLKDRFNSTNLSEKLLKEGIIIRDLNSYGLNAIRITVGTSEQNSIVFKKLDEIMAGD